MSTYSETLREIRSPGRVVRARRADLRPARALQLSAGVMLPLTAGVLLNHPQYGVYAALSALTCGFATISGEGHKRSAAGVLATAGMAAGAFVGAVAAGHAWPLLAVTAAFAYLAGIVGAFSDHVGAAAIQWPAALLLATATPDTPRQAAVRAGYVLAGGLAQTAITALTSGGLTGSGTARCRRRDPADFARHLIRTLRAHLGPGTIHGRHALRLAATASAAQGAALLLGLNHGYWAALTAVFVLKAEHVQTVRRILDRIGGTAIGVLFGILLTLAGAHGPAPLLLAAAATVALAYTVFTANYLLFSVFLTGFVVLLLDLLGQGAAQTTVPRLLATCLGGAAALIASHVRPRARAG